MAGLVVAVAAPPVAAKVVKEGMENQVFSQAAGAELVMEASLVKVTVKGLPVWL